MLNLNLPGPVIVFDTETGGLNADDEISWSLDREHYCVGSRVQGTITKLPSPILEIGAVVLNPLNLSEIAFFHSVCGKDEDESFKDFLGRCSKKALQVNGFGTRLNELEKAKSLKQTLAEFVSWIRTYEQRFSSSFIPCGQNVRFDIDMVNMACKKLGVPFQIKTQPLELISYSQLYFAMSDTETVANYKLTTVAGALGIDTENAHSALADVRMTAECMRRMFKKFSS